MNEYIFFSVAAIYALIVAGSYRKAGFIPALLFPLTIIVAGTIVYLRVVFAEVGDNNVPD